MPKTNRWAIIASYYQPSKHGFDPRIDDALLLDQPEDLEPSYCPRTTEADVVAQLCPARAQRT